MKKTALACAVPLLLLLSACISTYQPAPQGNGADAPSQSITELSQPDQAAAPSAPEEQGAADFEHSRWGDTMEQVWDNEGQTGIWILERPGVQFGDVSATARFLFGGQTGDVLLSGTYELHGGLDAQGKYDAARMELVQRYGEPQAELFQGPDEATLDSVQQAVSAGGTAAANWELREEGDPSSLLSVSLTLSQDGDVLVSFFDPAAGFAPPS